MLTEVVYVMSSSSAIYSDPAEYARATQALLVLDRDADLEQCEAALATASLAALQTRGVALVRLTMLSRRTGLYGRTIITFICNRGGVRTALPATKLSTGDIVGVVIPDAGPLKPRSTGVITECGASSVAVAFEPSESANTDEDEDFPDGQITLVSMTNDVTYRRLTRFVEVVSRITCLTSAPCQRAIGTAVTRV